MKFVIINRVIKKWLIRCIQISAILASPIVKRCKRKKVVILMDRMNTAGDNAEAMYRYLKSCMRDFTYIDDIIEGAIRVIQGAPSKETGEDGLPIPPYAVYNIGGGKPENLLDYIQILQQELVRAKVLPDDFDFEAHKQLVGMQPGDVPVTFADSSALEKDFGFKPKIGIQEGLRKFAEWYKAFYQV